MLITVTVHALIMMNAYLVAMLLINSECLRGIDRVKGVLVEV